MKKEDKIVRDIPNGLDETYNEQVQDNIADPNCTATKRKPNALGVNYCAHRKQVAKLLMAEIVTTKNGRKVYHSLTSKGVALFAQVVAAGPCHATVMQWLKKYEGFKGTLFTTFTVN